MDANGVRELLKVKLERAGFKTNGQAAWQIGIGVDHLSQILNGRAVPGPKVLKWMGLRRVFSYEYISLPELVSLHEAVPAPSPSVGKP